MDSMQFENAGLIRPRLAAEDDGRSHLLGTDKIVQRRDHGVEPGLDELHLDAGDGFATAGPDQAATQTAQSTAIRHGFADSALDRIVHADALRIRIARTSSARSQVLRIGGLGPSVPLVHAGSHRRVVGADEHECADDES